MSKVTPLGQNIILKVVESEQTTKGGIILASSAVETPVHGVVVATPEHSYHPNGEIKHHSLFVGETVCFMKNSGTTVAEAPEGERWLAVPEDCIYYKVNKDG